jgi:hypothetical protein
VTLGWLFENNIIFCRLPSHTSQKFQPCDVSVFSPLKNAYRKQVEYLERRDANAVNKEHFVLLYRRAREVALTARIIELFFPDQLLSNISSMQNKAIMIDAWLTKL